MNKILKIVVNDEKVIMTRPTGGAKSISREQLRRALHLVEDCCRTAIGMKTVFEEAEEWHKMLDEWEGDEPPIPPKDFMKPIVPLE
jgi:hypothetical protein